MLLLLVYAAVISAVITVCIYLCPMNLQIDAGITKYLDGVWPLQSV